MRGLLPLLRALWADERGGDAGARLGIGLLGGAAGFVLGGPFGASVGFLAGQVVGNILYPQELPDLDGPRLDGTRTMTSAYGDPIRIGYGQFVVGSSVAYYPGFQEHEIVEETGGKGGGPTQTVRSYTYTGSFRPNFCEGPAEAVLKMWANRILIYDATGTANPILDSQKINRAPGTQAIRIYLGTETQLPDPVEQADKGVADTPAYRGVVGSFFQNYPLDDTGGVPPQITALIAMRATEVFNETTLSGVSPNGAAWEWQPGKGTFLINDMTRISNESQTVMAANSDMPSQPGFPCVDSEGNFYRTHDRFAGGTHRVDKFDGVTLQQLTTGPAFINPFTGVLLPSSGGLSWQVGRVFGGVRMPDGTLVGELLFLRQQASSTTVVADLVSGQLINILSLGAQVIDSVVVDSERHLWTAHNDGGDIILNRISPGDGGVAETHTVVTGKVVDHMAYDPGTNSLILGDGDLGLIRWGIDSQSIEAEMTTTYVASGGKNASEFWNGPSGAGKMYLQTGATLGDFAEYDIVNMVEGRAWNPGTDFGLSSNLVHRGMYDESRNAMIKRRDSGGKIHWLYLDRFTGDDITVRDVVEDVSTRVGLIPGTDIVATNLTDTLHGYLVDRRMPARNALEPLRKFFFFNPAEEDFQVVFPTLGQASVATIPEEDLAAGEEDIRTTTNRLEEDLVQEVELPELLELTYANAEGEYLPVIQRAKRPRATTNSRRRRLMDFPGTFITNADAARRLETYLYNIWTKRRPVSVSVSQRWLALTPADTVTIVEDGLSHLTVLGSVDVGANNIIELKGAAEDTSVFTSVATGEDGDVDVQTIVLTGASEFYVLDVPLLRDLDDGFGVYLAAGPFSTVAWPGAEFRRSGDGADYAPFGYVGGSRAMNHGYAVAALADVPVSAGVWDRTSTLQVTMLRGTLPSSTEALVAGGANALLIGNEIVPYVTSVDDGNGKFTISTLLRGRKGTEGETAGHAGSERVVVLESTTLMRKAMDLSDQNTAFFYRAVTRGGALNDSARKQVTVLGKSQWKWAPAGVTGSIAADDWTVNWVERVRINGAWKNLLGTPADVLPDWEVDVLSGPGGTVLNTYDSTITAGLSVVTDATKTFFYTEEDQVTDFGSAQTTLTVKIYPKSADVGRGFPTEVTLVGG